MILLRPLVPAFITCAALVAADTSYRATIEQWRAQHEAELKAEDGWLTVSGLFWLKEGVNRVGSSATSEIVLPRGPADVGAFEIHGGKTTFRAVPGVTVKLNGKPVGEATLLKSDEEGKPDKIGFDAFTMFVIHRGERYAIRLKDTESASRKEFTGLHWFPVKERYRVVAKFVPYQPPKMITIPNILGETEQDTSPGYVVFTLDGQLLRLDPVVEDDQLFFIFHDLTSGKGTYPAGRFLYTDLPKNGEVVMDFNQAQNPPCAFTAYATCPLPPKQNRLLVRIEAGELNYGHH
ncbi:MAG TPA: DUF1684 domain-containing protein [Bryobacteraceae bacterium]|jgi:uncharacterized protein (DUF1684 family)|nr:DUF1684 domain-containing protein [Bryobacteraceae bacterium]